MTPWPAVETSAKEAVMRWAAIDGMAGIRRVVIAAAAALLVLVATPVSCFAYDSEGFPTNEDELKTWFPAEDTDADELSDPEPPPLLNIPGIPWTMQDRADDYRHNQSSQQDARPIEERLKDTKKRYGPILREAKKLIERPIDPIPPPPDYELECNDDPAIAVTTEQLVQSYVKKAANPELDMLTRLLAVRRELQLLGVKTYQTYQVELAQRLITKTRYLISVYGKDRNKVLAILGFAYRAQQVAALVGGEANQSFFAEIATWLKGLVPKLLENLRQKHDYRAVSAALALGQALVYAGGAAGENPDALLAEIEAAMTFDLDMKVYVKSTGANGGVEEWWLSTKMPMRARLSKGHDDPIPKLLLEGEGSGRYDRYLDREGALKMRAPGFDVVARIKEFNACNGTGLLALDRFYADAETYLFPNGPPVDLPMVQSAFVIMYGDKNYADGYEIKIPVTNLQAKAVDTTIEETMGVFVLRLTVALTHTPK